MTHIYQHHPFKLFKFRAEYIFALAATLSLAILVLPPSFINNTYTINPTEFQADLWNDQYSGGNSNATWEDKASQKWSCQMGEGYHSPYCNMFLALAPKPGTFIDLSRYNRMKIWLSYEGPGRYIRIYFRNRGAAYYSPDNELTTKYNMIELPVMGLDRGVDVELNDFTVAPWWLVNNNIPIELSKPEFDRIAAIEIQTGSSDKTGTHFIQLKRVELYGPAFSEVTIFRSITVLWILLTLAFLGFRFVQMQREIKQYQQQQDKLLHINKTLSLQSQQLETLAKHDTLTGLYNRLGMRDTLYQGLLNWQQSQTPFSILLIDLDYFKKINDTHGHDIGDAVLKELAKVLRSHVRNTDVLARWGGEEFILLCPGTHLGQALHAAESLRRRIEAHLFLGHLKITASFGAAELTSTDLDRLFKQCDQALYEAKDAGRNSVMPRAQALTDS